MKECSPDSTKTAFHWNDLNDNQRQKVIQKFKDMFGHRVRKNDNDLLKDIFSALTCRDMEFKAEKIVPKTFTEDTKVFWLGFCGSEDCGNYFYDQGDGKKQVDEHNRLFGNVNAAIGAETGMKEVILPAGTTIYELYAYCDGKWELDKEWPAFKTLESAQDRASHNLRFTAAFFFQWETWKDAGYKKPEDYDFTQELTFKFTKAQLMKGMFLDCHGLEEMPFYKKVTKPEVNVEFIEWCKANL